MQHSSRAGNSPSNIVEHSLRIGERVLESRSQKERKQNGQFLTPAKVARFMAQQLGPIQHGDRILDPAIGSGVLTCAVIDRVVSDGRPGEIWVEGYETDTELCRTAREVLKQAASLAASKKITVHTQVYERDFVLDGNSFLQSQLPLTGSPDIQESSTSFTHIIANPPYFKLNKSEGIFI